MKIEIKNRFTGEVIFSDERENNTIKLTVEKAVNLKINLRGSNLSGSNLSGINLSGSDLRGINLRGSNLSGSNLSGINLSGSDLRGINLSDSYCRGSNLSGSNLSDSYCRGSNLSDINLSGINLSGCDFSGCDLSDSNLSGSNLRFAVGNMSIVFSMQLENWRISFTDEILAIGCQQHTIKEWREFNDDIIKSMDSSALVWWKKWKDFVFTAIDLSINKDN